jgi:hypothetical protein
MTLQEHHWIMLGVLGCCYEHVPAHLKQAIIQGVAAAKTDKPLCGEIH